MGRTSAERIDVEFAPGLRLDLVRPDAADGPLPVIVWLHGGGWRQGDRTDAPDLHEHFARHGFAMVSIDYRLAPEATFPAQLLDVRAALRWIRVNALEYGLNAESVGLWGVSAGGHLAALAGLTSGVPQLPEESETGGVPAPVHAVAVAYAPADLTQPFSSPEATVSVESLLGGPAEDNKELARRASPIYRIGPSAPPFLIMQGTTDKIVPPDQAEALFDAIAAANHEATLYLVDDFGHGFLEASPSAGPGAAAAPPRLEAERDAPSIIRIKRHRHREEKATEPAASLDVIRDFFTRTLAHNPAAQ